MTECANGHHWIDNGQLSSLPAPISLATHYDGVNSLFIASDKPIDCLAYCLS